MSFAETKKLLKELNKKDKITYNHSQRVAYLSFLIGAELGLSKEELFKLKRAGLFHDIGKIKISNKILTKTDKLTNEEYEKIKEHTILGYEIFNSIEEDNDVKMAILLHHERVDGTGYPFGIKNAPLFAKIVSVADTFDAMTNQRTYNKPLDAALALMELRRQSKPRIDKNGNYHQLFDSDIVEAFIKAYAKEYISQKTSYIPAKYKIIKLTPKK